MNKQEKNETFLRTFYLFGILTYIPLLLIGIPWGMALFLSVLTSVMSTRLYNLWEEEKEEKKEKE